MGKKGSVIIPFLIEGSKSNKYGSCLVYDIDEKILRIHLPRKTKTMCPSCNQVLIDWFKKKGRCITDTSYSDAKHSVLVSLNKSCHVDPGSEMKIDGENYRPFKVLSFDESEEKRKKKTSPKKSIRDSNILPQTPNSEGYGSSLGSPQSTDQTDGEIGSPEILNSVNNGISVESPTSTYQLNSQISSPQSEGYGSFIESPASHYQLNSEIRSPHSEGYGSSIESPLSTRRSESGIRFNSNNYSDYESGIDSPMPLVGLNSCSKGNFGELDSNHVDVAFLNQQMGISDVTHDANMINVLFVQDCVTLNSLTVRNNEDEPMIQESEASQNLPFYQEYSLNSINEVDMHDASIPQPFNINSSLPETTIQNESADQRSGILEGNFQNGVEGYVFPNIPFDASTDNVADQELKMLGNAKDAPPTCDELFPSDLDLVLQGYNVSEAEWNSMLEDLMRTVDLPDGCENRKDGNLFFKQAPVNFSSTNFIPLIGETDEKSGNYYKLYEENILGETVVMAFKPMGKVPFDVASDPLSLYVCDELQCYKRFEFHPNTYGYLEIDVLQRIQASKITEIKEMGDHVLIFLQPWQTDAPKFFFPDADCLN